MGTPSPIQTSTTIDPTATSLLPPIPQQQYTLVEYPAGTGPFYTHVDALDDGGIRYMIRRHLVGHNHQLLEDLNFGDLFNRRDATGDVTIICTEHPSRIPHSVTLTDNCEYVPLKAHRYVLNRSSSFFFQYFEDDEETRITSPPVIVPLSEQEELQLYIDYCQTTTSASTFSAVRNLYPINLYENPTTTATISPTISSFHPRMPLSPPQAPLHNLSIYSRPSAGQQFLEQVRASITPESTLRTTPSSPEQHAAVTSSMPAFPTPAVAFRSFLNQSIYEDPFGFYAHAQYMQQQATCTAHALFEYQRMMNWEAEGTVSPPQYPLPPFLPPTPPSMLSCQMQHHQQQPWSVPQQQQFRFQIQKSRQFVLMEQQQQQKQQSKSFQQHLSYGQCIRNPRATATITSEQQQQSSSTSNFSTTANPDWTSSISPESLNLSSSSTSPSTPAPATAHCSTSLSSLLLPKTQANPLIHPPLILLSHVDQHEHGKKSTPKYYPPITSSISSTSSHSHSHSHKQQYMKPKYVPLNESMYTSGRGGIISATNPSTSHRKMAKGNSRKLSSSTSQSSSGTERANTVPPQPSTPNAHNEQQKPKSSNQKQQSLSSTSLPSMNSNQQSHSHRHHHGGSNPSDRHHHDD